MVIIYGKKSVFWGGQFFSVFSLGMTQMMVIKRLKLTRMTRTRISFLRKTSMMWRRKSEQLKRSLADAEGVGGWSAHLKSSGD